MKEIVARRDELQILLNLCEEVSLMYPLYPHFQLVEAVPHDDGYRLKVMQGEYDFDKNRSYFQHYSQEMPSYSDFVGCLLASGIIGYENADEFAEKLKHYRSMNKRVYFCPDTNVIYHRYVSSLSSIKPSEILLVETVKEEIEASLNFKYSPSQIAEMKSLAKYQPFLLDEFVNRRMKKSRRAAYIALDEYQRLKANALEIDAVEKPSSDKENNDRIIVKTLRRFEKERSSLPVLLTADNPMSDLCRAEGIEYFLFEYPHVVKADFCKPRQLKELVFNLACVFGVIRLNSVVVFGEFKGKNRKDEVKLRFLDNRLWENFERHLRICRRLVRVV